MDDVHLVPKFEIYIVDNLTFSVRVYLWNLPSTSIIYRENSQSFQFTTLSNFIALLTSHHICSGINLDNATKYSFIQHNVPKIYLPSPSNIDILQLHQTEFFRAENCKFLLPPLTPFSTPCLSCSSLLKMIHRHSNVRQTSFLFQQNKCLVLHLIHPWYTLHLTVFT